MSEDWQSCNGPDTATLTVQNVQESNEGSYRCVISNCAGSQTSKPAKLAGKDSVCTVTSKITSAAKLFDVGKNPVALYFDCQ